MPDVSLKMQLDAADALQDLDALTTATAKLGKKAAEVGQDIDAETRGMAAAWKGAARQLDNMADDADRLAKNTEKAGNKLDKFSKLGNVFSGLKAGFDMLARSIGSVVQGLQNIAVTPHLSTEEAAVQVASLAGGGAAGKQAAAAATSAAAGIAAGSGQETAAIMEQIRMLMAAGVDYASAIQVVNDAWVAAAGQERFASNIIEEFTEVISATGDSMESFFSAIAKTGIDLRETVMQLQGLSLEEFQEAASKGKFTAAELAKALHTMTAEGTAAAAAYEAATQTTARSWHALTIQLQEDFRPLSEKLFPIVTDFFSKLADVLAGFAIDSPALDGFRSILDYMVQAAKLVGGIVTGILSAVGKSNGLFDFIGNVFSESAAAINRAEMAQARGEVQRQLAAAAASSGAGSPLPNKMQERSRLLDVPAAVTEKLKPILPTTQQEQQPGGWRTASDGSTYFYGLRKDKQGNILDERAGAPAAPRSNITSLMDSLAAIGGGGRSVSFRDTQQMRVQEQQLSTQKNMLASLKDIGNKLNNNFVTILA